MQFIHKHSVEPEPCLSDWNLFIYLCQWEAGKQSERNASLEQSRRCYESWNNTAANGRPSVPLRALVVESLSQNNLLGLEAFHDVLQLHDGVKVWRVEVDNQPHGAHSGGAVSRGRPGGRAHARAHEHTRTHVMHDRHSRTLQMNMSLSAVVFKWSISKCLPKERGIWPKELGFQDEPIIAGVDGSSLLDRIHCHF